MRSQVESPYPIDPVVVSPLPDGGTDIWLHRDITQITKGDDTSVPQTVYTADEVYLRADTVIDLAEATARFDELWATGTSYDPSTVKPSTPAEQWRADVENALVELADMIAGGE